MAERGDVQFISDGVVCRAWLHLPDGDACLVFEYRNFGASDGQHVRDA